MKLTLAAAAWILAASAGASLAHTNPAIILDPFDVKDMQSSVTGGTAPGQDILSGLVLK
ncbi:MAG: hypothetical protein AAF626_13680 [Pseudomonadota bacterium]